jgi:hypothetical protein
MSPPSLEAKEAGECTARLVSRQRLPVFPVSTALSGTLSPPPFPFPFFPTTHRYVLSRRVNIKMERYRIIILRRSLFSFLQAMDRSLLYSPYLN